MLTLQQAVAIVDGAARLLAPAAIEHVDVLRASAGVLAMDLQAPRAVPGFACSAMDGYALRISDLAAAPDAVLREDGATLAGATCVAALAPASCRRITTGAPIPEGADTVVMHEQTRSELAPDGGARVEFLAMPREGANVRSGADDFESGHRALRAGKRLDAIAIATAVAMGFDHLPIRRMPSVAVITTGDELLAAGAPWRVGLRYDSNGPLLERLLAEHGVVDVVRSQVRDDVDELRSALADASSAHRLVIVTGGVSAGEADHLPRICAELGETLFWKLRFRPGMPALFARIGESLVLGLPGNPVSVLATFVALVRPALAAWCGCAELDPPPVAARLSHSVTKQHDRLEWRRGTLLIDAEGVARVSPHPSLSSGALRSLLESNVLLELSADCTGFEAERVVPVRPWRLP